MRCVELRKNAAVSCSYTVTGAKHDAHARQRRRCPRARAPLPGHRVNLRRCAHLARPSPDDSLTEAETAPIARRWQLQTPPNDLEKTMTTRRTTEERISEKIRESASQTTMGGRKRDLYRERSHQRVSWTGC